MSFIEGKTLVPPQLACNAVTGGLISGWQRYFPPVPVDPPPEFEYTLHPIHPAYANVYETLKVADVFVPEEPALTSRVLEGLIGVGYTFVEPSDLLHVPEELLFNPQKYFLSTFLNRLDGFVYSNTENLLVSTGLNEAEAKLTFNGGTHWVLLIHGLTNENWLEVSPYCIRDGLDHNGVVIAGLLTDTDVTALPNTADGYILYRWRLDGGSETYAEGLVYTVPYAADGEHRNLNMRFEKGYVVVGDNTVTQEGYNPVLSGNNRVFNADVGSPPTGYRYQWYLNGNPVGTNSSSYTVSARTDGSTSYITVAHELIT